MTPGSGAGHNPIAADNPIRHAADDALGRVAVARSLFCQVMSLDASEGVVVGVLGEWGSGLQPVDVQRSCISQERTRGTDAIDLS